MNIKLGDVAAIKALALSHKMVFEISDAGKKVNYESYKQMMIEKSDLIIENSLRIRKYMKDIEEYDRDMFSKTNISILSLLHADSDVSSPTEDKVAPKAPETQPEPVEGVVNPALNADNGLDLSKYGNSEEGIKPAHDFKTPEKGLGGVL